METPKLNSHECSVPLWLCDGDHGKEDHGPSCAQYYDKSPLVSVKVECDADDAVVSHEPIKELKQPLGDSDSAQFLKGCSIIKTENKIRHDVVVKQELDIGPTVLQESTFLWPIPPQTQAGPDPRRSGGPGGCASPASRASAVPRADAEDHYRGRESGGLSEVGSGSGAKTDGDHRAVALEQCRAGAGMRETAWPRSVTELARGTDGPGATTDKNTGGRRYECDYCKCRTTQKYHLANHLRTHTGDKPYKCKLCEYRASYSGNLKRHMCIHTGYKPYKCKLCEYSASSSSNLTQHMRTHTGDKPYKCELCEYNASQLGHLKQHMHTHTGVKPFKCKLCEYGASNSCNLKRHMITHSTEKPFKCKLCEYSAAQISYLKLHILTHSRIKPWV